MGESGEASQVNNNVEAETSTDNPNNNHTEESGELKHGHEEKQVDGADGNTRY